MKSFQSWSILCLSLGVSEAFAPPAFGQTSMRKSICTHASSQETTALFMSEDGAATENKLQRCLMLLEKRVKYGPGSLTADEVTELAFSADSMAGEINDFNSNVPTIDSTYSPPTEVYSESQFESVDAPAPSIEASWGGSSSQQASPGTVRVLDEESNTDEGPAYDGTGGMGLSRGTKNTYIIEGMDEMTSEEYRAALQKAILDTQAERRKARRDVVGNRAAHDYLSTLGWGGTSKALSRGKDFVDE
jgi:hypothetical protein